MGRYSCGIGVKNVSSATILRCSGREGAWKGDSCAAALIFAMLRKMLRSKAGRVERTTGMVNTHCFYPEVPVPSVILAYSIRALSWHTWHTHLSGGEVRSHEAPQASVGSTCFVLCSAYRPPSALPFPPASLQVDFSAPVHPSLYSEAVRPVPHRRPRQRNAQQCSFLDSGFSGRLTHDPLLRRLKTSDSIRKQVH